MSLEKTLVQLMACPHDRAQDMGRMGYIQWLAALPGSADYEAEAARAYLMAMSYIDTDPAVEVFCTLLRESLRHPLRPLDLALQEPRRRGGARERRAAI